MVYSWLFGKKITPQVIDQEWDKAESLLERSLDVSSKEAISLFSDYLRQAKRWRGPQEVYSTQAVTELIGDRIIDEIVRTNPDSIERRVYKGRNRIIEPENPDPNPAESNMFNMVKEFGEGTFNYQGFCDYVQDEISERKEALLKPYQEVLGKTASEAIKNIGSVEFNYAQLLNDHKANLATFEANVGKVVEPGLAAHVNGMLTIEPVSNHIYRASINHANVALGKAMDEIKQGHIGQAAWYVSSDNFIEALTLLEDEHFLEASFEGNCGKEWMELQQARKSYDILHPVLDENIGSIQDTYLEQIQSGTFEERLEGFQRYLSISTTHSRILEETDEDGDPSISDVVREGIKHLKPIGASVIWQGAANHKKHLQELVVEYQGTTYQTGIIQQKELEKEDTQFA